MDNGYPLVCPSSCSLSLYIVGLGSDFMCKRKKNVFEFAEYRLSEYVVLGFLQRNDCVSWQIVGLCDSQMPKVNQTI